MQVAWATRQYQRGSNSCIEWLDKYQLIIGEDENEETVNDPDEIAKNLGGDSVFLDLLALSIEKIVKKR